VCVCVCVCVADCCSCSVLQCVAICCNVLQCVAVCCSVLHCVRMLQCVTVCYSALQCALRFDWCCFYYFARNRLVALLEALCARIVFLDSWISVCFTFFFGVSKVSNKALLLPLSLCCSVLQCVMQCDRMLQFVSFVAWARTKLVCVAVFLPRAIKRPRTRSTAARPVSNAHGRDLVTNQNV